MSSMTSLHKKKGEKDIRDMFIVGKWTDRVRHINTLIKI